MNRVLKSINNMATGQWESDCAASVDYYNAWFMDFVPPSFRAAREQALKKVKAAFQFTKNLQLFDAETLRARPEVLAVARKLTCPPLARDRLSGLSEVSSTFIKRCEESDGQALPEKYRSSLQAVFDVITKMLDKDILTWLSPNSRSPSLLSKNRAAIVIADRLCGALADPILRNAQEKRQLKVLSDWLVKRGYQPTTLLSHKRLKPGQYAVHVNMPCRLTEHSDRMVNVSVDLVILPKSATIDEFPILIEAKPAGDFTNVNKRRKEEAKKMEQRRGQYGRDIRYLLFLCGNFDAQYLGYEASEGIDWIWEHRISDIEEVGL